MSREKPTKAQARRAKKDRVVEAARAVVNGGVISSKTTERRRSYNVDAEKLDRLRDAVQELDR